VPQLEVYLPIMQVRVQEALSATIPNNSGRWTELNSGLLAINLAYAGLASTLSLRICSNPQQHACAVVMLNCMRRWRLIAAPLLTLAWLDFCGIAPMHCWTQSHLMQHCACECDKMNGAHSCASWISDQMVALR